MKQKMMVIIILSGDEIMKKKSKKADYEDTIEYGEFVCSLDHWILPEKQKKRVNSLEKITEKHMKEGL